MAIHLLSAARRFRPFSTSRGSVARAAAAALVAGMVVVVVPTSAQAAPEPASAVRGNFTGGATGIGKSDDGSAPCASNAAGTPTGCTPTAVAPGFPINFYGTTYNNLFINNNGNLTFGAPNAAYSPFPLASGAIPIIAPFFADVDTRPAASAQAVYSNKTISGHNAFGVTWPLVGCFNLNTSVLDDFQVVLIDRTDTGSGNFDIEFNYNQVQWDAGQASGGNAQCVGATNAARIGFAKGNGATSTTLELPGSATNNVLDGGTQSMTGHSLNSTTPGRYYFTFRNGIPTNVTTLTAKLTSGTTTAASITTTAMSPVTEAATLAGQTSTAGGTVTYTVYSDSLCSAVVGTPQTTTVTNGSVPAAPAVHLPIGTYQMVASYSGDANNNPSATPCGANILTVTAIPLNIIANNQSKAYGTPDPAFTYTASGLLPGDSLTTEPTCTVSVPHTAPGTYPITCTGGTADPTKYVISAHTAGTLTVTPATVTVTADNKSKVYGTADPTFTYSVSGLVGNDTLTTQPTCSVTGVHTDAGTYPITCSGADAGGNYTISYQPGTLTVTKAPLTITADNQTKTYGTADPTFSSTTTGLVAGDSLTTQPTCAVAGAHSDVGTYPITCSGADAGGNYTISYQPGTLTVTKASLTITADNQTKTYGTADPTFSYTTTGLAPGDSLTTQPTCTVSGGHADVGTYAITCSGAVASGNYDIAYAPGTLTVTRATVTITADNQTTTYGDPDPTFTYAVTGLVGGDTLTTRPTCSVAGAHTDAGTYPITCSGADAGGNYVIHYQAGTLTVMKATVTVTADSQSKVYGTADPTFTYAVSGLVGSDTLTTQPTCDVSVAHHDVGTYPITCSGAVAGDNYDLVYEPGTLKVTRATVTVAADNKSKVYGAADPAFTFTTTGLVGNDTLTSQPTCGVAGAHSDAGTYPITCSGADAGNNYTIAYQPGTLTVIAAALTITADDHTKQYGTADPAFGATVTGLVGSDTLTTQPTCGVAADHTNVGSYSIDCSGAEATSNYSITYQPGTLTVTKAAILITADNKSRAYGAADPAFTFTTAGLVGSDTLTTQPTCTVSGTHVDVGSYPITCSGADAGGNYTISYQPGTLTITKATPVVTTVPSPGAPSGGTVSDSATLDVGTGSTSGVVTFRLYGPNDPGCTQLYGSATGTITANHAVSGSITVLPPGVYRWTATYPGDVNTNAVTTACAEPVTIGAQVLTGRAYGLAASYNLLGLPLTLIPPTPDTGPVSTTASSTVTRPCVNLTGPVAATGLCPSVTTTASPSARSVAKVSVATVNIGVPGLPVISVKALESTSTTTCAGSTGTVTLEYLAVGSQVVISAKTTLTPNTKIQVGGVTIVLDEQVPFSSPDKGLTVNGLRITAVGLGVALNAVVAPSESDIGNCP